MSENKDHITPLRAWEHSPSRLNSPVNYSIRSFRTEEPMSPRPRNDGDQLNLLALDEAIREKLELELKLRKLREKSSLDESRLHSLETQNRILEGKNKELSESISYYECKSLFFISLEKLKLSSFIVKTVPYLKINIQEKK